MKVDFTPDPELYPFESRWFDSSHGRVHYIDEGSRPANPVVPRQSNMELPVPRHHPGVA